MPSEMDREITRAIERLQDAIERNRLENATLTKSLESKVDNLDARFRDFTRESDKHVTNAQVVAMAAQEALDEHKKEHKEARKWLLGIGGAAIIGAARAIWESIKKGGS